MKRSSLPERIADVLGDQDAEARARQLSRRLTRRPPRSRVPAWALAAASLLVVGSAFALHVATREEVSLAAVEPGLIERGIELAPGHTELGAGSSLEASEDVRAVVVESDATRLEVLLEAGRIDVEIVPGGARRVEIDAGLARITVVGTHFVVGRRERTLEVAVSRGRVLVRGELVAGRSRIVAAGEAITVREPEPSARDEAPDEPATEVVVPEPLPPRHATPWRELADTGAYGEAWEALGAEGLSREMRSSGPADLLALADVARRSGHPEEAVAPLELLLTRFPDDADTALGAFTLGRLRADALGQPGRAAEAFEIALAGRLPSTLLPDTVSRLALAYDAAGEHDAARRTAERYLAAYPEGARVTEMRAIVSSP